MLEDKLAQDFAQHLRRRGRSDATVHAYSRDLAAFAVWFSATNGETMTPERITALDMRDYKGYLQATRNHAPATVNRKLAALSVFFTWARDEGLTTGDPTGGIKMVRRARTAPRWLERSEQRDLARELEIAVQTARTEAARFRARRDQAMAWLMLGAGLRVGEVAGLKLADLTLRERSGQVVVRAETAKGDKQRTAPLNATVRKALVAWLEVHPGDGDPWLFLSQKGGPMSVQAIYRRLKGHARRAGLERITPHNLRHSCAKNLADRGVSLDRVAAILGHESLDTTALYTQPSQADLAHEMDKIAWEE
ncbi:MAG: tyrosine-type recombinase/integrase [Chloroflexota bacterium]